MNKNVICDEGGRLSFPFRRRSQFNALDLRSGFSHEQPRADVKFLGCEKLIRGSWVRIGLFIDIFLFCLLSICMILSS